MPKGFGAQRPHGIPQMQDMNASMRSNFTFGGAQVQSGFRKMGTAGTQMAQGGAPVDGFGRQNGGIGGAQRLN